MGEISAYSSLVPLSPSKKRFRASQGFSEGGYLEHSGGLLIHLFLTFFLLSCGDKARLSLPCSLLRILTLAC